jgi:hypothetical protein
MRPAAQQAFRRAGWSVEQPPVHAAKACAFFLKQKKPLPFNHYAHVKKNFKCISKFF